MGGVVKSKQRSPHTYKAPHSENDLLCSGQRQQPFRLSHFFPKHLLGRRHGPRSQAFFIPTVSIFLFQFENMFGRSFLINLGTGLLLCWSNGVSVAMPVRRSVTKTLARDPTPLVPGASIHRECRYK